MKTNLLTRHPRPRCRCSLPALFFFIFILTLPFDAAHGRDLVFSTNPFANPATIHKTFQPLIDYLAAETSTAISLKIAPNYLAHVKALGNGDADLGFAGPSPYVRTRDKYGGIELLARIKMIDDRNDKVVIICRTSAPYTSLTDLKGESFAFGDHQSFGSHFMPRWLLHQHGVTPNDLIAYDFVKSHDNVILNVLHGDFAAGGVRLDVFDKYADRPLRVLAGPAAIPPHVIVCGQHLDATLKEKLRQSLLKLNNRTVLDQINRQMEGFQAVSDNDFDLARQVMGFIEAR